MFRFALLFSLFTSAAMAQSNQPPDIPREFRGVWVATVSNIDWPTEPGLPVEEQKAELMAILDRAVRLNLNAIIFQVRTGCDALYPSEIEPWSYYLTGVEGQDPGWDPLQTLLDEAHARAIEVHAWFNPFRARRGIYEHCDAHISQVSPELVYDYSDDYEWLDPGRQEAQDLSHRVIMDVVNRYDIDAVHFDDYFYPYPIEGIDFPDGDTYQAYRDGGGELALADWRRDNINRFIQRMSDSIHQAKPWMRFGISPFGIWRPGHPEGVVGFDAVDGLYADSRLWLQEGWIDYFAPQLYWPIDSEGQPFEPLLDWWIPENTLGRHLWPGLFTTKAAESVRGNPIWPESEVVNQVNMTRAREGTTGVIHYSDRAFRLDWDAFEEALSPLYAEPALVPASPWLDDEPPTAPTIADDFIMQLEHGPRRFVTLNYAGDSPPWLLCAQWVIGTSWHIRIVKSHPTLQHNRLYETVDFIPWDATQITISAIDRAGNVSEPLSNSDR